MNNLLSPFVKRIADKHDKQSPEGWCAHQVSELRLEATPDVEAEGAALTVLLIIETAILPGLLPGERVNDARIDALVAAGSAAAAAAVQNASSAVAKREAWTALSEIWIRPSRDRVEIASEVGSLGINVLNGDEFSYARSVAAPILDLRYLSTRAA